MPWRPAVLRQRARCDAPWGWRQCRLARIEIWAILPLRPELHVPLL